MLDVSCWRVGVYTQGPLVVTRDTSPHISPEKNCRSWISRGSMWMQMQLSRIGALKDCGCFLFKKVVISPFFPKWKSHYFLRETPLVEFQGGIKRVMSV